MGGHGCARGGAGAAGQLDRRALEYGGRCTSAAIRSECPSHASGERARSPWSAAAQRRSRALGGHSRRLILPRRHHAGDHHRRHPCRQHRPWFRQRIPRRTGDSGVAFARAPQRGGAPRRALHQGRCHRSGPRGRHPAGARTNRARRRPIDRGHRTGMQRRHIVRRVIGFGEVAATGES